MNKFNLGYTSHYTQSKDTSSGQYIESQGKNFTNIPKTIVKA